MERISKMWRSGLAMLLALCLLISACPVTAFAADSQVGVDPEGDPAVAKYVAIGDSMVNGYGLDGYLDGTKNVWGYQQEDTPAYPVLVANEKNWDLTQLALSGFRAHEVCILLGLTDYYDEYADAHVGSRTSPNGGFATVAKEYKEAIAEADVISVGLGTNNFGSFFTRRLFSLMLNGEALPACDVNALLSAEAPELAAQAKPYVAQAKAEMVERLAAVGITEGVLYESCLDLADAAAYSIADFVIYYKQLLDYIAVNNSDAEVIVVGMTNASEGMVLAMDGQSIDLGSYYAYLVDAANAYMYGLPAAYEVGSSLDDNTEYGLKVYYAGLGSIAQIADEFENEVRNNPTGLTRQRFVEGIAGENGQTNGMIFGLLSGLDLPVTVVGVTQENVAEYEKLGIVNYMLQSDANKAASVALYKAFENAVLAAVKANTLDASALKGMAGGLNADLFKGVMATYTAETAKLSATKEVQIAAAEAVATILSVAIRDQMGEAMAKLLGEMTGEEVLLLYAGQAEVVAQKKALAIAEEQVKQEKELMTVINNYHDGSVADMIAYHNAGNTHSSGELCGNAVYNYNTSKANLTLILETMFGAEMKQTLDMMCMLLTLEDAMTAALVSDTMIMSLLNMYGRFKLGEGIGIHPSAKGHAQIKSAVVNAYDTKHTAKDEAAADVEVALSALKGFLEEYGPDAAEVAYQYLLENGYIEKAEVAVEELIKYLTENSDELAKKLIPALEEAIKALEAQNAELKVLLETLKKDLNNKLIELENAVSDAVAAQIKAAIAQLEAAIEAVEALIEQTNKQIAELNKALEELVAAAEAIAAQVEVVIANAEALSKSIVDLVETLKNTGKLSAEALAKAYEQARETVLLAIDTLEAAIDLVTTQVAAATELAEKINGKVTAVYANVSAALNEIIEKLPEDMKEALDEAAKKIREDLNAAIALVNAELEKAMNQVNAEMNAAIEATKAELNALLGQIDAHVAEKTEELKAAAEAQIKALEAEAEKKIAELKAAAEAEIAKLTAAAEAEIAKLNAAVEAQIAELKAAAQSKIDELNACIAQKQAELAALKAQLENAAEEAKAQIKAQIAALEAEIAALQAELNAAVAELNAKIEAVKAELEAEIAALQAELDAAVAELNAKIEAVKAELKAKVDAINAELMAKVEAVKAELKAKVDEINAELKAKLENVRAEIEAAYVASVEELEKRIAALEAAAEKKIAELKAAAEAQIATLKAAAEAKVKELKAAAEAQIKELKAAVDAQIAAVKAAAQGKIDELNACIAQKQAELAALKAQLENAAEEAKAQIKAQIAALEAEIAALQAELNAAVAELNAKVEALKAELNAKVDAINAELQAKLDAINAELKAKLDAINAELIAKINVINAELKAQIDAVRACIDNTYAGAVAALEKAVAALEGDLLAQIKALTDAAEAEIAKLKAAAEAELAKLGAVGEAVIDAVNGVIEYFEKQLNDANNTVVNMMKASVEEVKNMLKALDEHLKGLGEDAMNALVDELKKVMHDAFVKATTSDLGLNEESTYIALGDGTAAPESYVEMLGEKLKAEYGVENIVNYAKDGNTVGDEIKAIADREGIADADLITIGFGNVTLVENAFNNAMKDEPASYNWVELVGEELVPYVQDALADIYAEIAAAGLDEETTEMLNIMVEGIAYGAVEYAIELPALINAIRAVNTDAVVIIVGQYNPMDGVVLEFGGMFGAPLVTLDIADYINYLVDGVAAHGIAYSMITGDAIFVEAPQVDTDNTDMSWGLKDLMQFMVYGFGALNPSESGDGYITNQILEALNISKIEVKPEEPVKPVNPFVDVPEGAFYYDAVMWAVDLGITTGTQDGTTFEPNSGCTRAHVATFLWRAAGCPEPESTVMPFKDVAEGKFYTTAVLWAAENGITNGTGDGTTFEPNATCTRGQIVTMLARYLKGEPTGNNNPFKDVPANAYYTNPVLWAVENGITNGTQDGTTFEPNSPCTRGHIVTFLYRALNK